MKWSFVFLTFFSMNLLFASERLPEKYLISYGNPEAKTRIVEYFSFVCPHCIELFKRDFKKIKSSFLETNEFIGNFIVPLDVVTVQALACLEDLSAREKRFF